MANTGQGRPGKWAIYIFLCLVFLSLLTPLLNFKALLFPFVTTKAFYFRIVIELALPFYVYLILSAKNLRPNLKQPLSAAILIFLALNILSAIFGVNFFRSFFGNFERMGGVYYLAHLTLLYFYLLLIAQYDAKFFQKFLQGLVWVSVLVCVNGISGKLGGPALSPDISLPSRVSSTLGNPIFLASFLILPLVLALFFAFVSESKQSRIVYYSASAVLLFGIYLSGTRGAFVGILAGLLAGTVFFLFLNKDKKIRKWTFLSIGVFCGAAIMLFVFRGHLPQESLLSRAFALNDSNAKARLLEWQVALKGFTHKPILGVGQENYYVIANKYYNPEQNKYDPSWFDKPHNFILEILDTNGILGLAAYLALIFSAIVCAYGAFKGGMITALEFALLFGGWLAYQVQNLFVFDTVSASITFFAFAAFLHYLRQEAWTEDLQAKNKKKFGSFEYAGIAFFGVSLLAVYAVYVSNILPMRMSKYINFAIIAYTKSAPPQFTLSKEFLDKAAAMNFVYDPNELFFKYSDMALAASQSSGAVTPEFSSKVLSDGIALGEKTSVLSPNSPVVWYYLAALRYFDALGLKRPVPDSAVYALEQAKNLAPTRPEIYYLDAQFNAAQNNLDEARKIAEEYYANFGHLPLAVWQMAWVNYKQGNLDEAYKYAQEALVKGYKLETLKEAQVLIDYQLKEKNYGEAVRLYEEAAKHEPENENVYIGLVRAYSLNGQATEASDLARQIIAADPAQKEALSKYLK